MRSDRKSWGESPAVSCNLRAPLELNRDRPRLVYSELPYPCSVVISLDAPGNSSFHRKFDEIRKSPSKAVVAKQADNVHRYLGVLLIDTVQRRGLVCEKSLPDLQSLLGCRFAWSSGEISSGMLLRSPVFKVCRKPHDHGRQILQRELLDGRFKIEIHISVEKLLSKKAPAPNAPSYNSLSAIPVSFRRKSE